MARRAGTSTSGDVCRLNSGDLLSESDGFEDADGQWEVAWSADRVASETQLLRSDGLLGPDDVAFGDNGAGDPCCIDAVGTVSVVSPVTSQRVLLADSLSDFWDGWFCGPHHYITGLYQ
jgi:hypothetical protein